MKTALPVLAAAFALVGCGAGTQADNAAEQLDDAADQSTPAAAEVLQNAAEAIEAGNTQDPNAAVQAAVNQAGKAQALETP